jgi:ATPase subunit of ABC transporter with duplicated ATPase domains
MFTLQHISYLHLNGDLLFDTLDLSLQMGEKVALVGDNGIGKSTLLKIIAGEVLPTSGQLKLSSKPYYVPQIFGQYNNLTIAEALQIDQKLKGLKAILAGDGAEDNFTLLADDWTIEERCAKAMVHWGLQGFDLDVKLSSLSGGEKTKVFLSGIAIHDPQLILFDEPSNHLDRVGRDLLYSLIEQEAVAMLVVSHDRMLLNLLGKTYELSNRGIEVYGGNYDFYVMQKSLTQDALLADLATRQKELRKAKSVARETIQRQQKLDAKGKNKQEKAGASRIMLNTLRNKAENSTARSTRVHTDKLAEIAGKIHQLNNTIADDSQIQFGFSDSVLHRGKVLFRAEAVNHRYGETKLWQNELNFQVESGDRIVLGGINGAGKTTLIKIILGELTPAFGRTFHAVINSVYIDQEYALIQDGLTVYEQACFFNSKLLEHEIKIRLDRFLFTKDQWDKSCAALSGGEKMRLILCCLTIQEEAPALMVLDEPTNNLDLRSLSVLTAAVKAYRGTVLLVSHDEQFLQEIDFTSTITL